MNVWLLTNTPSPYQVEFFSAIGKSGKCRLSVRFMHTVHRGIPWAPPADCGFDCRELRGTGPRWWSDAFRIHPDAMRECAGGDYDFFVLSGQYTSLTFIRCAQILRRRRKPWAMWLERPWPDDYRPPWANRASVRIPAVRAIRRLLLRSQLRRAPAVFCIGTAARDAYRELGVSQDRLFVLPYYCDVDRFAKADPAKALLLREQLNLLDKTVFLFSGALIERKGVDVLLAAFQQLAHRYDDIALVLLGAGSQRQALEDSIQLSCRERIHFAGHVPQEELPAFFNMADVFVFPSRHDGWGVVINEACGAGLPIIATDSVGASQDLVRNGWNGFVTPRDDIKALAERMEHFLTHPEDIDRFGDRSREITSAFTLQSGVQQLLQHIAAIRHPPSTINH